GAVTTILHHYSTALGRMLAERAAGLGAKSAAARRLQLLLRDQRDRAIETDAEHVVAGLEICVSLFVLHVGAIAADAGEDGLAGLRMTADCARQRQQSEREIEIDRRGLCAFRQTGTLRFLAVHRFAELHIGAETACPQRDVETGVGILAQDLGAAFHALAAGGHLPGEAALRIVRAADERTEPAELERQAPAAATRALAGIAAVGARRKDMRRQK